jgi:hypothetical protein
MRASADGRPTDDLLAMSRSVLSGQAELHVVSITSIARSQVRLRLLQERYDRLQQRVEAAAAEQRSC